VAKFADDIESKVSNFLLRASVEDILMVPKPNS